MKHLKSLCVFAAILLLPVCLHAQFLDETPEYARFSTDEYVDVYYEFTKPQTFAGGFDNRGEVARGSWDVAESARKRIVCESHLYPDSTYSIERNGKTTVKNSNKNGRLELEIEASDNAEEVVIQIIH